MSVRLFESVEEFTLDRRTWPSRFRMTLGAVREASAWLSFGDWVDGDGWDLGQLIWVLDTAEVLLRKTARGGPAVPTIEIEHGAHPAGTVLILGYLPAPRTVAAESSPLGALVDRCARKSTPELVNHVLPGLDAEPPRPGPRRGWRQWPDRGPHVVRARSGQLADYLGALARRGEFCPRSAEELFVLRPHDRDNALALAAWCEGAGRLAGATEIYRSLLHFDPDDHQAARRMGKCHEQIAREFKRRRPQARATEGAEEPERQAPTAVADDWDEPMDTDSLMRSNRPVTGGGGAPLRDDDAWLPDALLGPDVG